MSQGSEDDYCRCDHVETHVDESVWAPSSKAEKVHSPTQRKPYCKICGKMKYMGSAHARKIGFYINLLGEIQKKAQALKKRGLNDMILTEVQKRTIINELREDEFFLDVFSNNHYSQYIMFKKLVLNNSTIPPYLVDSVYEDFRG